MATKGRGGKREGAGRKAIYLDKQQKRSITAPGTFIDYAENLGAGNLSKGFRRLVEFHQQQRKGK